MTTNSQRESATIYQFPARGRFASALGQDDRRSQTSVGAQRTVYAVSGGAWYHDEAIRESEDKPTH